jgi:hypothetical protein
MWYLCKVEINRVMEELHTDSIDGHEASYGARSRARERAYSNLEVYLLMGSSGARDEIGEAFRP